MLDPTWTIDHTGIHLTSTIYNFGDNLGASVAVVFANVMFIMLVGAFAYTITRNGRTASRDHHMQAWHLRNLIPEKATHPTAASLAPPSSPPAGSARG